MIIKNIYNVDHDGDIITIKKMTILITIAKMMGEHYDDDDDDDDDDDG